MKSAKLTCITAIALFVSLAIPHRLAAQDGQDHNNDNQHHNYKLIDLGTFGGTTSWFCNDPNGGGGACGVLNNRGTLVSGADTSLPNPNYLNSNAFLPPFNTPVGDPLIQHAFRWKGGALQDLGTLPGGYNSFAQGISPNGLIAGLSENGGIDPFFGLPEVHAVLWQNKGHSITDLGTLEGGYESTAFSVNDRAQVVGFALNTIPDTFYPLQVRAFLWQNGRMQDLGTLGTGTDAMAFFVNKRGQVAGNSFTNMTINPVTGMPTQDPFLWENGSMTDLGTLGGSFGYPNDLNDRGQVVGLSDDAEDVDYHAFLWPGKDGRMRDLGTLGGCCAIANWINDSGAVVGGSWTSNDLGFHAFLWKGGIMTDLGPPAACTEALGINAQGQVVGFTCGNGSAMLWDGGQAIDLNIFNYPGSGLQQLGLAYNINDRGEIAGLGVPPGCGDEFACGHTFVLIPCDENHPGVEGCDYAPADVTTREESQPATPQKGIMPPSTPAQRHHRYRGPASSWIARKRVANDLGDEATTSFRGGNKGYCALDSQNRLTGTCIGNGGQMCVSKSDPAHCPIGKQAISPTNYSCQIGQVTRVDAARQCTD